MSNCTFSMAPLITDGGVTDYSWRLRVQFLAGTDGSTYFTRSDYTFAPSLTTGILSFAAPYGQTLVIEGRGHPGFATRVTVVVPSQATYDLALIADISISTPPASGGLLVTDGVSSFRAGTLNIIGGSLTESPTGQANITVTGGSFASLTGLPSDNSALASALALKASLASPTFTGTVTVPTPSNATDAATKGYVDSSGGGVVDIAYKVSDYTTFAEAVTAAEATGGMLIVDANRTISSNTSVAATVQTVFWAKSNATLTINSGVTLTLGRAPIAPQRQIFVVSAPTALRWLTTPQIYPEWFGAIDDWDYISLLGTDNTAALKAAFDSLNGSAGGDILLYPKKGFAFASALNLDYSNNIHFKGAHAHQNAAVADLIYTGTGSSNAILVSNAGSSTFENVRLQYTKVGFTGAVVQLGGGFSDTQFVSIRDCAIEGTAGIAGNAIGIKSYNAIHWTCERTNFSSLQNGIVTVGTSNVVKIDRPTFNFINGYCIVINSGVQSMTIISPSVEGGTDGQNRFIQLGASGNWSGSTVIDSWVGDFSGSGPFDPIVDLSGGGTYHAVTFQGGYWEGATSAGTAIGMKLGAGDVTVQGVKWNVESCFDVPANSGGLRIVGNHFVNSTNLFTNTNWQRYLEPFDNFANQMPASWTASYPANVYGGAQAGGGGILLYGSGANDPVRNNPFKLALNIGGTVSGASIDGVASPGIRVSQNLTGYTDGTLVVQAGTSADILFAAGSTLVEVMRVKNSKRVHIAGTGANTSGLRFDQLTSASPAGASTAFLALDSNGEVVRGAAPATFPADPNANTILGWDDTDNAVAWLTIGSGLTYTHSTHTLSASGGGGGTPGGSDTQVQFNDGGSFAGSAGLVYDKTAKTLSVVGATSGDQIRLGEDTTNYYKVGRDTSSGFLYFSGTQTGSVGYQFTGGYLYVPDDAGFAWGNSTSHGSVTRDNSTGTLTANLQAASGANFKVNLGDAGSHFGIQLSGGSNVFAVNSSGAVTITGVLTAGSGPTTVTDSAGKVLSAALNTVAVAQGGSGLASLTAYAVLAGGTTSTGNLQQVSGVGTSGQVLTSNGAGALPTWQAAGGGGLTVGTTAITSGTATRLLYETSGNKVGEISGATSDGTSVTFGSGNLLATSPKITTGIADANGNSMLAFTATASAVNAIGFTNSVTGTGLAATRVEISPSGSDANISLSLLPKGTSSATQSRILFGANGGFTLWGDGDWQLGNNAGTSWSRLRFADAFSLSRGGTDSLLIQTANAGATMATIDQTGVVTRAAEGSTGGIKVAFTIISTTDNVATITATNLIPAGCLLLGVTTRVRTALGTSHSLSSVSIGDGTTANLFSNNSGITSGTTTDLTNHLSTFAPKLYTAAGNVVVTANGGNFDATGQFRITVYYIPITAPTS